MFSLVEMTLSKSFNSVSILIFVLRFFEFLITRLARHIINDSTIVMRNLSNDAYFHFCGKMGVATTRAPNKLGLPNPAQSWSTGWNFISKSCFINFNG